MLYAVLVYETPSDFADRTNEKAQSYWGAWGAYFGAMQSAGVASSGGACLQAPSAATTLRQREGVRHVVDGPYADAKEQLGGMFVIDVPNLDAAIQWASRAPCAGTGAVEVRPIVPVMGGKPT